MPDIHVLDAATIDQIAAGEVVERPSSVVKELVENSIDAGATIINVQIMDGGTSLIRVADNGEGIARDSVPVAFLRHSTSKIEDADDLTRISSLGFRGEALASIAAVSKVEMTTKRSEAEAAVLYRIEGGREKSITETGASDGTSICIRHLFYNVPVRRKFLKTPMSEAVHIYDTITHLALSHPSVAMTLVSNGQEKLRTTGNGNLTEMITRIYGAQIAREMLPVDTERDGVHVRGMIGSPAVSRGTRAFETFFINNRYIRSNILTKALEEAYRGYTMQHRFPICVLYIEIDPAEIDINIHPTKSEVRFQTPAAVSAVISDICSQTLKTRGLVPQVAPPTPEPVREISKPKPSGDSKLDYYMNQMRDRVMAYHEAQKAAEPATVEHEDNIAEQTRDITVPDLNEKQQTAGEQIALFSEEALKKEESHRYTIIGQLFGTYWLIESDQTLYIIDQHAAHEKVLFEQTMKRLKDREFTSQNVSPPIVLELTPGEELVLKENAEAFERIGYRIEPFGAGTYAVTSVPDNLFGVADQTLLKEMLTAMTEMSANQTPDMILERVASLSCKAAVKGNTTMDRSQMDDLIRRLFELDNPYHCPHGRPTMIAMTRYEIDKKFKRIV